MKYAILSDIHSNLEALKAVLEVINFEQVDRIVSLGDICGYATDAEECIKICKNFDFNISGNHDISLYNISLRNRLNSWAVDAIKYQEKNVSKENIEWLRTLPRTINISKIFTITHSSLFHPANFYYILTKNAASDSIRHQKSRACFFGHTHKPVIFKESFSAGRFSQIEEEIPENQTVTALDDEHKYLINPGSVGQPRDKINSAGFLILDTFEMAIKYYRVPYDFELTAKKIKSAGLPDFLADRLKDGR